MRIGLGLSGSPGARLCQRRGLSAVGRPLVAFYASLSPGSARLLKGVSDLVHHTETPGMGPSDAM